MNEQHESAKVQVFLADHDSEGVWFYQAFNHEIADWAVANQTFAGCPAFKPLRMTWIKPSFAWVLYRSGYGRKGNQGRILRIKIGHEVLGQLLSKCACGHGHGGALGRVQWDPERDITTTETGKAPRKMLRARAIQIGLSRDLSEKYVNSILEIQDVTQLAHRIGAIHKELAKPNKRKQVEGEADILSMEHLAAQGLLPNERPYLPHVAPEVLAQLALAPGDAADEVFQLGLGKAQMIA